jgi:hypothetical protein
VDAELLAGVFKLLKSRVKRGLPVSTRDMLSLAQCAQKLKLTGVSDPLNVRRSRCSRKHVSKPSAATTAASPMIRCVRNLTPVPSFHYDAIFERVVHERWLHRTRWRLNCLQRCSRSWRGPPDAGQGPWFRSARRPAAARRRRRSRLSQKIPFSKRSDSSRRGTRRWLSSTGTSTPLVRNSCTDVTWRPPL